jgi:hypothetical protein
MLSLGNPFEDRARSPLRPRRGGVMTKLVKFCVGAALTVGTITFGAGAAGAHNHVFTPLGCLTTDNPNAGAIVGFAKAADAAAPLNGPSPVIVVNASGKLPTGGQGAANACK